MHALCIQCIYNLGINIFMFTLNKYSYNRKYKIYLFVWRPHHSPPETLSKGDNNQEILRDVLTASPCWVVTECLWMNLGTGFQLFLTRCRLV